MSDIYESIDRVIKNKLVVEIKPVYELINVITLNFEIITNELINIKGRENENLNGILEEIQRMIMNLKHCYFNMINSNIREYVFKK